MTIDDIKALIAADESRTLELKKTTGELKDGMHSACAFLNTDGGWLIFGVAPTGLKILGQQVTETTKREIAQAVAGLEPAVDVKIYYVDVPDRPGNKVIAMHFDGWVWGERPHTFHGCPYYKVESTTKVMPHEMYDERIRAHQPQMYAWERQMADGVTLSDLNEKHIRGCIRLGVEGGRIPASAMSAPIGDTLAKWSLLKNGNPTNGAVMLSPTILMNIRSSGFGWPGSWVRIRMSLSTTNEPKAISLTYSTQVWLSSSSTSISAERLQTTAFSAKNALKCHITLYARH